ncbi:MAG: hypothetical protein CR988_02620 [Treponema sp.]|nr:MAG: hypothetical protein CR988_02620 [Treponema sp.]
MALSVLDQAKKEFAKKKYHSVISILQPHVIDYRDSFAFHLYLALAFMHIGEIGVALDYLARAREIKITDPDLLAAQAALFLRRADTTKAIEYYLQALDSNPNYSLAKKGLDFVRKNNTPESIGDFVQSGKIKKLYPDPLKSEKRGKKLIVAMIAGISILVATIIIPYMLKTRSFENSKRKDISELNLVSSDRSAAVDLEGNYKYVFTNDEIIKSYEKAQKYFQEFRDNAAQYEINKILFSNASVAVKQKARLLMNLFEEPTFDTIKDIYEYSEVIASPDLYLDCWVVWRGMPTNISIGSYNTAFDLMVGYDTKHKLEGIVPVFCDFVTEIDMERPIEVLGRVQIKSGVVCLDGSGLHQSGKPLNKK